MESQNPRGGGKSSRKRVNKPALNSMKTWTAEDDEYLREKWGTSGGVPSIAKELGRSVDAIKNRAIELKLGPYLDGGEDVSYNQLYRIVVGKEVVGGSQFTLERWKKLGLRIRRRRVDKCMFYIVSIDDFWRWANEHQDILDFSRFEENALGIEPDWAKRKRKIDQRNRTMMTPKKCPWSPQEDALLTVLCESGDKTHEDLQRVFQRTSSSIRRRIYDLALPRPLKSPTKKWTPNDLRQLVHMTESGYGHDWIAKTMNRSAQAVRGKLEWIEKKGLWEEYGGRPLQASGHRPDEQRARQAP